MGGLGELDTSDLCEWADGNVGACFDPDLVGYPAVECVAELPSGEEVNSEELQ